MPPPKVFNPPVRPDWAVAVFAKLVTSLLEQERCDVISFGPVSDQHEAWRHFNDAGGHWDQIGQTTSKVNLVHSVFDLPATMKEFLGPFGKSRTKYRGRYELRPIKKIYTEATTDVICSSEILEEEFDRFAFQHTEQWRTEGKPGHFGDWPSGLLYNRALVKAQGALGRVRFTRVLAAGRVVASQYIFAFGRRYYWELSSREMGKPWDDFRLGSTAALTMVGQAIHEGVRYVEAGLGHYPYKLELGAKEYTTRTFLVVRYGLPSRLRKLFCDGLRLLLTYGYNKIWFRRIQPRLPERFHRPQWQVYIKFDY